MRAHPTPLSWPCLIPRNVCSEYPGHKKKVHTVAWNCVGSKLASGSVDQCVRVWSLDETGRAVDAELRGHTDSVDQLRWCPTQADVLGTASGDKTVRIWDARMSKCANAIETRGENINIRWSPDGQHIAVGDKEDNISLIEMRKWDSPMSRVPTPFPSAHAQHSSPCLPAWCYSPPFRVLPALSLQVQGAEKRQVSE